MANVGVKPRLLVIQSWISFRGAEHISVQITHLASAEHGWDARLLTAFVDEGRLPPHGDEIAYIAPPRWVQRVLRASPFLYLLIAPGLLTLMTVWHARSFDVINPHNPPCETAAAIARLVWRRPVIWTCNALPPRRSWQEALHRAEWIQWWLAGPIVRWAARHTDGIISASSRVAEELQSELGLASIPIHQAVDFELFEQGDRKRGREICAAGDAEPILLLPGQLHPRKEQPRVLEALPELVRQHPRLLLILAGAGPAREEYEAMILHLGVSAHVRFTGYLERRQLAHLYALANLTLVPYWRDEGSPAVPFEALAAGTPSLVARGCGADELIEAWHAGMVWDPAMPLAPAVIEALDRAAGNEGLQWVVRGREHLHQELTWQRYVSRCMESFKKALDGHADSPASTAPMRSSR